MSDTREAMQDVARAVAAALPPNTGFIVLAFDCKPGGRLDYVSNGKREDAANALRSWLDHVDEENFAGHEAGEFEMDRRLVDMRLWAWVGEDELGSKEFGLKQAHVPAGYIPLVACKPGKIDAEYIRMQMRCQARAYHKTISLVQFRFARVEEQVSQLSAPR